MGCLSRIREFYPGFTSSEQKIADFILGNADHALECTAAELSVASGVSPATVIRFTKTIGFSGFSEMKLNLARDMEASIPDEM
ncbi:MAG: MurR/RpiR family transcriptional regulator, partial [Angelakisella sp.]